MTTNHGNTTADSTAARIPTGSWSLQTLLAAIDEVIQQYHRMAIIGLLEEHGSIRVNPAAVVRIATELEAFCQTSLPALEPAAHDLRTAIATEQTPKFADWMAIRNHLEVLAIDQCPEAIPA